MPGKYRAAVKGYWRFKQLKHTKALLTGKYRTAVKVGVLGKISVISGNGLYFSGIKCLHEDV
jgi:hypothetical protein